MKRIFLALVLFALFAGVSFAEKPMKMDMKKDMKINMPAMKKIEVDGYTVEYNLMTMMEHHQMMQKMKMDISKMEMDMKASHHLSLKISDSKSKKEIKDAVVKLKAIAPDKTSQELWVKWNDMMKHYGCDLRISDRGKYGIIILFKTADEKKHIVKFWEDIK
ncbi:MAG: hypothetical protein D6734_05140 [Candidatus Schekmanbacteria bacterium]|nr:MAG: hypothetical protein D6734_05140 [Candidatus Schekmanbacteria bacterium]